MFALPSDAQQATLKSEAPAGFAIGAVLHSYSDWDVGSYADVAATEFNAITVSTYMPWGPIPADLDPNTAVEDVPITVSYTHLTLPTTPYV